jgi:hypothetical protein
VESSEIIANLPFEPNVQRDLLRNLRVDARELGNIEDESLYVKKEIEASDYFCMAAFLGSDQYVRNKYSSVERFGFLRRWLFSKLSGMVWGHGEKPLRVMCACLFFILVIASLLLWHGYERADMGVGLNLHDRIFSALGLSVSEFLGIPYIAGDYPQPVPFGISIMAICVRYIFIGLLVSVLFRSFSRR